MKIRNPIARFLRDKMKAMNSLEREFTIEIQKSERTRTLFVVFLTFSAALFFLFSSLGMGIHISTATTTKINGLSFFSWLSIILTTLAFYELLYSFALQGFINKEIYFPFVPRIVNTIIETTILFGILYLASFFFNAHDIFFLPAVFIVFILIILSTLRLSPYLCLTAGAVSAMEYWLLWYIIIESKGLASKTAAIATTEMHVLRGIIILLGGIAAAFVAKQIKKKTFISFQNLDEKNRVQDIFGQHVSPEVMDKLIDINSDDEEEKDVCVMFLDIRGFTAFCEDKSPVEIISYLNKVFDFMIEIINEHHGIINKFLGDGFMALFGAPLSSGNDVQNALNASLKISEEVERMSQNNSIPDTKIGIGLHYGTVVTGNVGSSTRKEYTIIGDIVNLASRLEQLNKRFKSTILISKEVFHELTEKKESIISLGKTQIRGHEEEIEIFKAK